MKQHTNSFTDKFSREDFCTWECRKIFFVGGKSTTLFRIKTQKGKRPFWNPFRNSKYFLGCPRKFQYWNIHPGIKICHKYNLNQDHPYNASSLRRRGVRGPSKGYLLNRTNSGVVLCKNPTVLYDPNKFVKSGNEFEFYCVLIIIWKVHC